MPVRAMKASPSLHTIVVGAVTLRPSWERSSIAIARYHPSPPRSAPWATISEWNRSRSAGVIPPSASHFSPRPPRRDKVRSGRRGSWKKYMYQESTA